MPKGLKYLTIENFLGINSRADPSDSNDHQCQTIENFEISNKIGVLYKSYGYELATDILGSKYTTTDYLSCSTTDMSSIAKIHEWNQNRDSAGKTIVCAGTDEASDGVVAVWSNVDGEWERLNTNTDSATFDTIHFYNRDDALIAGCGLSTSHLPKYIKYYDARSIFGATNNQTDGYQCYVNNLEFDDSEFTFTVTDDFEDGGWFNYSVVSYYMAAEYDDGQIGPISDPKAIIQTSKNRAIRITVSISNTNGDEISRRITGIYIYRFVNDDLVNDTPYWDASIGKRVYFFKGSLDWKSAMLLLYMPLNNDEDLLPGILEGNGAVSSTTLTTNMHRWASVANDMLTGMFCELETDGSKVYRRVTATATDTVTLASAPTGGDGTYNYRFVPYWWDNGSNYNMTFTDRRPELTTNIINHINRNSKTPTRICWKFAIFHSGRGFYAPVYLYDDEEEHLNWVAVSNINGAGNYEYDVIETFINLSEFGVDEITGLGRIMNYIVIFSKSDIHKLNIGSGSQFSWSIDETLDNVGCIAEDSIKYISGDDLKYSGYYYVSRDGVRVYDGYKSTLISVPIEDIDNYPFNVTDMTEAIGGYDDRLKQYIVSFPTDSTVYKFDLRTGEWITLSTPDAIEHMLTTQDGELLALSSNKIYVMNNDGSSNLLNFDGSDIKPSWKSKVYDFGSPGVEKILHEISIRYKSNTDVNVQYYIDGGSANDFNGDSPFPSKTSIGTETIGFPVGSRCYTLELSIGLTSTDAATNTDLQIEDIRIGYELYNSGRD